MTKIKQVEKERKEALAKVRERVKEQACLYKISALDVITIEELLKKAVRFIPTGWQNPTITAASIEFEDQVYRSNNYRDTDWKLTAERKCLNSSKLKIDVVCLEQMPASDYGPFLKEEVPLMDSIANHLESKINQLLSRQELQDKDRRLEKMGQMSRIGYWEFDLENDEVHWSDMTKQIFEVSDDLIPDLKTALSFYKDGEDWETIMRVVNEAIKKGKPFDVELRIITANGNELWTRSIGEPQMNKKGICVHLDGSFQNIDQQKRTEIESEQRRLLLETITDKTEAAIWVRDRDGRHVFVNQEWRNIFNLNDKEIIGKTAFELLDEGTARGFQKNDNTVLDSDQSIKQEEQISTSQGSRYYLTNIFPMGEIPGVGKFTGGIATDITEGKANEQKLNSSLKEKEFLLGEVHHRVKNNLAIISSLITLQMLEVEDANFRKVLENSINRVHSIAMVHELLYQSESFTEIPFEKYIRELLLTIKKTLGSEKDHIDLVTNVKLCGLNINQAIPLGLLLNELMTNSLKYAFVNRKKGEISFSIARSGDNIKVLYEDNGGGYPDHVDFEDTGSFGHTLIHTLLKQLQGDFKVETKGKFRLAFQFAEREKGPHSNFSG